jgi:hypothetical protein
VSRALAGCRPMYDADDTTVISTVDVTQTHPENAGAGESTLGLSPQRAREAVAAHFGLPSRGCGRQLPTRLRLARDEARLGTVTPCAASWAFPVGSRDLLSRLRPAR